MAYINGNEILFSATVDTFEIIAARVDGETLVMTDFYTFSFDGATVENENLILT